MALDINGYNATFRTFVEFAEKTQRDGYDSACAKATLAGKRITVSALSLHETSYVLRKTGEKTANDSTRAIFRNAVLERLLRAFAERRLRQHQRRLPLTRHLVQRAHGRHVHPLAR